MVKSSKLSCQIGAVLPFYMGNGKRKVMFLTSVRWMLPRIEGMWTSCWTHASQSHLADRRTSESFHCPFLHFRLVKSANLICPFWQSTCIWWQPTNWSISKGLTRCHSKSAICRSTIYQPGGMRNWKVKVEWLDCESSAIWNTKSSRVSWWSGLDNWQF